MKISIEFETDNAAWGDDWSGEAGNITAQIRKIILAMGIEGSPDTPGPRNYTLRDSNGNAIGIVRECLEKSAAKKRTGKKAPKRVGGKA